MLKMGTKTVGQIAQELGISNQAVLKRINNLSDNHKPTKVGGAYVINSEIEALIKGIKPTTNPQPNNNQPTTDKVVSLQKEIEHLKEQAKVKDKQIAQLNNQADTLHKLLDQQQQLTLISNKEVETLKLEMKEKEQEAESKPKGFFARFKQKQ